MKGIRKYLFHNQDGKDTGFPQIREFHVMKVNNMATFRGLYCERLVEDATLLSSLLSALNQWYKKGYKLFYRFMFKTQKKMTESLERQIYDKSKCICEVYGSMDGKKRMQKFASYGKVTEELLNTFSDVVALPAWQAEKSKTKCFMDEIHESDRYVSAACQRINFMLHGYWKGETDSDSLEKGEQVLKTLAHKNYPSAQLKCAEYLLDQSIVSGDFSKKKQALSWLELVEKNPYATEAQKSKGYKIKEMHNSPEVQTLMGYVYLKREQKRIQKLITSPDLQEFLKTPLLEQPTIRQSFMQDVKKGRLSKKQKRMLQLMMSKKLQKRRLRKLAS
ncbi:MAG: hypothetical protein EOM55_04835 [Clostridia bacterium]|nr:hypothetical protein [Clostridia bacterium]